MSPAPRMMSSGGVPRGAKRIDVFALGTQGFAAGRQDADMRRLLHDRLGQGSHRVDHVLAAVEHEKHVALAQVSDDVRGRVAAADGQAQGRCQRIWNRILDAQEPEVEEADLLPESVPQLVGHGQGHGGLADPAGAMDGDEAMVPEQFRDGAPVVLAVDDRRRAAGQRATALPTRAARRMRAAVARGCSRDGRSSIPDRQR